MIRKMIHMDVPAEMLLDIFADSPNWPKWMPGMKSARIIQPGENKHVAMVQGTYAGVKFNQEMEVTRGNGFVRQVQKDGWPVCWGVTWRCIKPPTGIGSTVVAEVEMTFAAMAPKKMIMNMLRRMVGDMLAACKKRAEGIYLDRSEPERAAAAPTKGDDRVLLAVYQTEKGLEVTVGDRTFVISGD